MANPMAAAVQNMGNIIGKQVSRMPALMEADRRIEGSRQEAAELWNGTQEYMAKALESEDVQKKLTDTFGDGAIEQLQTKFKICLYLFYKLS